MFVFALGLGIWRQPEIGFQAAFGLWDAWAASAHPTGAGMSTSVFGWRGWATEWAGVCCLCVPWFGLRRADALCLMCFQAAFGLWDAWAASAHPTEGGDKAA